MSLGGQLAGFGSNLNQPNMGFDIPEQLDPKREAELQSQNMQAVINILDGSLDQAVKDGNQKLADSVAQIMNQIPGMQKQFGGEISFVVGTGRAHLLPKNAAQEANNYKRAANEANTAYLKEVDNLEKFAKRKLTDEEKLRVAEKTAVEYYTMTGPSKLESPMAMKLFGKIREERDLRPEKVETVSQETKARKLVERQAKRQEFLDTAGPELSSALQGVNKAIALIKSDPSLTRAFISRKLGLGEAGLFQSLVQRGTITALFKTSGKQVTDKERQIFDAIYSPGFFTDPKNAQFRLNLLKDFLEALLEGGSDELTASADKFAEHLKTPEEKTKTENKSFIESFADEKFGKDE